MSKILPVIVVLIIISSVLLLFMFQRHPSLINYDIKSIEYIEPFNTGKFEISKKDVKHLVPYLEMVYEIDEYKISSECKSEYGSAIVINGKHTLYYECNAKYDDMKVFVPEKAYNELEMIREKY